MAGCLQELPVSWTLFSPARKVSASVIILGISPHCDYPRLFSDSEKAVVKIKLPSLFTSLDSSHNLGHGFLGIGETDKLTTNVIVVGHLAATINALTLGRGEIGHVKSRSIDHFFYDPPVWLSSPLFADFERPHVVGLQLRILKFF
jgi:hypothetical protein